MAGRRRPPFWKRRFIVNEPLQKKLLVHALACTLMSCSTILIGEQILSRGLSIVSTVQVIALLAVATSVIFLVTLLLSHAIAGPIFRIEREMRKVIADEKVEAVVLRKSDHFAELAATYNDLVTKIQQSEKSKTQKSEQSALAEDSVESSASFKCAA